MKDTTAILFVVVLAVSSFFLGKEFGSCAPEKTKENTNCSSNHPAATYGKESGLPKNCQAIVETVINNIKYNKRYTVQENIDFLERTCGAKGTDRGN